MKRILFFSMLILALCVPSAHAQSLSLYNFETGVDAKKWVDISTGSTSLELTGTDVAKASAVTNIGFTFTFAGTDYTQFSVNSAGNLRFGSTATGTDASSSPFGTATIANKNAPKINFFGANAKMVASTGGGVKTKLIGEAPNRVLIVEFAAQTSNSPVDDNVIWQVQLFETTNAVQIVYSPTAPNSSSLPYSFQIGMSSSATDVVRVVTATNKIELGAYSSVNYIWPSPNRYYLFTTPTCYPPTGITSSNVTTTSADVSWTASGMGESQWQYVLTLPGETPDWSTATLVSTTSCSLTGLIPSKNYTIHIRSYCSATEQSKAATAFVHTLFAPLTPALFGTVSFEEDEGFVSATTPAATAFLNGQNNWVGGNASTTTATYIPFVFQSTSSQSGKNCLKLHAYRTSKGDNYDYAYAVLPQLDFTTKALNQHQVVFYARKNSTGPMYADTLWVGVMTDPANYATFTKVCPVVVPSSVYAEYTAPLSSYQGAGTYIAIMAETKQTVTTGNRYGSFYVDDLQVEEIPACKHPTNLAASDLTTSQAVLSWTPGSDETLWNLRYRVRNTENWTTVTGVSNPYTLTGLAENTPYEFKVQADCLSEQSKWSKETAPFRTLRNIVDPETLGAISFEESEGFEVDEGNLANGWTAGNLTTTNTSVIPYVMSNSSYANTGSSSLKVYASYTSDSAYAVMPNMAYHGSIKKYKVAFHMRKVAASSSTINYNDTLYVGVVQDPTDLSTLQIIGAAVNTTLVYSEYEIPLSSCASSTGYIVFLSTVNKSSTLTNKHGGFFVDDVKVYDITPRVVVTSAMGPSAQSPYDLGTDSIYKYSTAADNGGVLNVEANAFAKGTNLTFKSNSTTSNKNGGAVYSKGTLHFAGKTVFTENASSSSSGGAISVESPSTVNFSGQAVFTGNTANLAGGAIMNYKTITFSDSATFKNNQAKSYGGAINNSSGTITFAKQATFTGNKLTDKTTSYGGAVRNSEGKITFNEGAVFDGNTVITSGGAVYNEKGTITFSDKMDLKTSTDTWVNTGTSSKPANIKWDLTGGLAKYGTIKNFQYYSNSNEYVKQTITVSGNQELGDYVIATGDMTGYTTDKTGKYKFLIVDGGAETLAITVGDTEKEYGKCKYSLTSRNDSLILTAASNAKVKIGDMEYTSFADAIKDIKAGDTLKLTADLTGDSIAITTPDVAFTLDLNGHKYQNALAFTATNNLTITDSQTGTKGEFSVQQLNLNGKENTVSGGVTVNTKYFFKLSGGNTLKMIGSTFNTTDIFRTSGKMYLTDAKITADSQLSLRDSVIANGNNTLTSNNKETDIPSISISAPLLLQSGITNMQALYGSKRANNTGLITVYDGATLDITKCDSLLNKGSLVLKGGQVNANAGAIKNKKQLMWDITDKKATSLKWTTLTNTLTLDIAPGLAQPKDTTYIIASEAAKASQCVFNFTGVPELRDTTAVVYAMPVIYGNRLYSLDIDKNDQLVLHVQNPALMNEKRQKYYISFADAIKDIKAGDTLKLMDDITGDNIAITTPDKAFTIDLNGHKYNNAKAFTATNNLTITDSQTGTKGEFGVKGLNLNGKDNTVSGGVAVNITDYFEPGGNDKAISIIGSTFNTSSTFASVCKLYLTDATITSSKQICFYRSVFAKGNNTFTGKDSDTDVPTIMVLDTLFIDSGTTSFVAQNGSKRMLSRGNIIVNDGATLDITECDSLVNDGSLVLKGGKVKANKGAIKNKKQLTWDIADKKASAIEWRILTNSGKLAIAPGLEQPKDTTYTLAGMVIKPITDAFTLTGIDGKEDKTVYVGGKKVYYGNRLYSLYANGGGNAKDRSSVRPTISAQDLILKVEPGVCRIREVYYETLDLAIADVQKGDTIVLLTDIEMENSLELPAGTFLNLDGFSLTNPTGLDLRWDLTGNKAPVVLDFDKLNADGTLTISLPDKKLFGEIVLAEDAALSTDKEFVLTGAPTFDGKDRTVAVGGDRVFYGHRFYSLSLNNDDQIVLNVERVIAPANEVWAVSTDGSQLALSSTDGYNARPEKTELVAEDALTRFVFDSEVTRIGRFGLEGNTALKEVYLSENIETVQPYAFRNCSNLELVSMGTKVEEINENAFDGCEKLDDINLESGLKEIDAFAFRNCKSLVEVMLPKTIEYVGSRSFWGCEAMEAIFILGTDPEKINMTQASFEGMKEHTPIFVTRNKLILFEAYNYGKGINFQTMGIATLDADQTGMGFFCHHNMIVPQGATAYGVTWNGTSFDKGESAGEGEVLEGGKGYLFTGAPDVYIIETTSKPATKSIESDLTGTMEDVTVGELKKLGKVYYAEEYKGGLMYRLTKPTDILTPGEAFAIITDKGTPAVKYFDFDNWYNGWMTGVQTPSEPTANSQQPTFNLAGQAVGSDYKGIVIKNGKKYLNR